MDKKIVAESEDELLAILKQNIDDIEICDAVLKHPYANERVFDFLAQNGPIGVVTSMLTVPKIHGTVAQRIAQQRLQEAVQNNTTNGESDYDDYDERETGTCDCRWR